MRVTLLKSKLHRATVTDANLEYEGSISIDPELYKEAGMYLNEKVEIFNLNNGERFATYIINGSKGEICLNGAAARLVHKGDKVIIIAYGEVEESEAENWKPKVLLLDDDNNVKGTAL